jgi:hypothetical protein
MLKIADIFEENDVREMYLVDVDLASIIGEHVFRSRICNASGRKNPNKA